MVDRVSILTEAATPAPEQQGKAFAALWRRHIVNLQKRYSNNAGNRMKLENGIQIGDEGCLGVIGERIVWVVGASARIITLICPLLAANIFHRHRSEHCRQQPRFQKLSA